MTKPDDDDLRPIRVAYRPPTHKQWLFLLREYGLTRQNAADIMDVTVRTVHGYMSPRTSPNYRASVGVSCSTPSGRKPTHTRKSNLNE